MIKQCELKILEVKTLAQGAINKNLISLPKELFQCELIDVFKNALIMVREKS